MSKQAIQGKRGNTFHLDAAHVHVAGYHIPESMCVDLGIVGLVAQGSNEKTLEEMQPEGFVASHIGKGNFVPIKVVKVPCDPDHEFAYIDTKKDGEQIRCPYIAVVEWGRCRARAVREANELTNATNPLDIMNAKVFCLLASRLQTPEESARQIVLENHMRKKDTIMEIAHFMRERRDAGVDVSNIAKAMGKSAAAVYQMMELTDLSPELQGMVDTGELPKVAAAKLAKAEKSHEVQVELVSLASDDSGKVSGNALTSAVEEKKAGGKPRKRKKTPNREAIREMLELLRETSTEAAEALHWVLTGDAGGLNALVLGCPEVALEAGEVKPSKTTQTTPNPQTPRSELPATEYGVGSMMAL